MNGEPKREWFDTNYYDVLGVSESATQKEITKAYRALARKFHPDANPGDERAEERFKEISTAYDVVGDETRRKQYDEVRRLGPMGGAFGGPGGQPGFDFNVQGGDLSDILGSMFGGGLFGNDGARRPRGGRKGRDQEARLSITFSEAVRGTLTPITLNDSSGSRTMKVRVPAGVGQGQRIRLRGKGGPGDPPGDLYVIVEVGEHPYFDRDGAQLTLDLPVTFTEAALGADVSVPMFEGEPVTVRIPAGTQSGRRLRVKGAGVPAENGRGDLLATVQVVVPSKLTKKQQEALRAYAELSDESPRRHLERAEV